jgi:hypothetical protein
MPKLILNKKSQYAQMNFLVVVVVVLIIKQKIIYLSEK